MAKPIQDKDADQQRDQESADSGELTSEPLMKTPEVMNYLRVSRTKLWQLVKEGGLPAFRIGGDFRYRKSEIDAWLEARRHGPANNHSKETK